MVTRGVGCPTAGSPPFLCPPPSGIPSQSMSLSRVIVPEILDSLPHGDPRAVESRRELGVINRVMGNPSWFERNLRAHAERAGRGERILELGAGDGALARYLWAKQIALPENWTALDLAPPPAQWSSKARWVQRDLFAPSPLPDAHILLANLFLHHFQVSDLVRLQARVPPSCRLVLVSEPARRRLHLGQGRLLAALLGLGEVTRHDMQASIHAGFLKNELPEALFGKEWSWKVSTTLLGAYRLRAWR